MQKSKGHIARATLSELALRDMQELVGEPDWFADLRDRLVLALLPHDAGPLERLAVLGAPAAGGSPYDESGELVTEPRSVQRLRAQWERELTWEDLPPGLTLRPASHGAGLQRWKETLYESFQRR